MPLTDVPITGKGSYQSHSKRVQCASSTGTMLQTITHQNQTLLVAHNPIESLYIRGRE